MSAHTALSVRRLSTENGITTVCHSPYSPDLTPCDCFLLPRLKKDIKGKRFADINEVKKKKTTEALVGIIEDEFKKCFKKDIECLLYTN